MGINTMQEVVFPLTNPQCGILKKKKKGSWNSKQRHYGTDLETFMLR